MSYNTYNDYEKKIIAASIKSEIKEDIHHENTNKNINKNSFLCHLEIQFENLVFYKYKYTLIGNNSPLRNILQVTRFIVINSDNKIMSCCTSDTIILCYSSNYNNDVNDLIKILTNKLKNYKINLVLIDELSECLEKNSLSSIIYFTLVCKYLESGKWYHYGDDMEMLIESSFAYNTNKNDFFKSIGFQIEVKKYLCDIININNKKIFNVNLILLFTAHFYKILPLISEKSFSNMRVYCLPRCVNGSELLFIKENKENTFDYKNYWYDIHGYVIGNDIFKDIAMVQIYISSFYYPLGLILREKIFQIKKDLEIKDICYIINFINVFDLLKGIKMNFLNYSEPVNNIENINSNFDLNLSNVKKDKEDDFFDILKQKCFYKLDLLNIKKNIEYENNNKNNENNEKIIKNEISSSKNNYESNINNENLNCNGYITCRNILSNSTNSINLNYLETNNKTDKCINEFLKKSALIYSKNTLTNNIVDEKNRNEKNIDAKKIIEKTIDEFLTSVTNEYDKKNINKIENNKLEINIGESIISNNFSKLIDNLIEEEYEIQNENCKKLKTIDFNERENKRPNFNLEKQNENIEINKKKTNNINEKNSINNMKIKEVNETNVKNIEEKENNKKYKKNTKNNINENNVNSNKNIEKENLKKNMSSTIKKNKRKYTDR